jgi:hypothetical protein
VRRALLSLVALAGTCDVALALLWQAWCRRQNYDEINREIERWTGHAR